MPHLSNFKLSYLFSLSVIFFCCVPGQILKSQTQDNVLEYRLIEGSGSSKLHSAMGSINVQRLLLDIAQEPRNREYLKSKLRGTQIVTEDLLDLGLIRVKDDLFTISFLIFSSEDLLRMREITESHARMLATGILNRRTEIEKDVKDYQLSGVDPHAVLYIIIGCFSLDWDGLALTEEKGYWTSPSLFRRIFPKTIVYAWQPSELSKKTFYKGSHNTKYGKSVLTSFGDHQIQPRHAFPDVLWQQDVYPDRLKLRLKEILGSSSEEAVGKQVANLMSVLRGGSMNRAELTDAVGTSEDQIKKLTDLLVEFLYINEIQGKYSARIPVLTSRDSLTVQNIRKIGGEELERWLEFGYPQLQKELMDLAPFRYGVPQCDLFYEIWHDIFGAANRMLVESGLFADPYSDYYGAKGIIPVVFDDSLYEKP